jgi:hypothetical protein
LCPGNAQISRNKVNTRRGWPIIRHCATANALNSEPLDERVTNPRSRGTNKGLLTVPTDDVVVDVDRMPIVEDQKRNNNERSNVD